MTFSILLAFLLVPLFRDRVDIGGPNEDRLLESTSLARGESSRADLGDGVDMMEGHEQPPSLHGRPPPAPGNGIPVGSASFFE